ncbi:MAG: bifunctional diaminohydroxyphosphoribosylaminopyrimidine deaminase/5-amino-6-(5-phosphoribosylamino)uracil reductase RibD [Legionellaceae bacterium]
MHEQFLLEALAQAWLGRGLCAPNPAVGAIAVHNGTIIAQAFHEGPGSPHAEQRLLAKLPRDCSNITIYVTLEPCNHWGKTPPCIDALIERSVAQVVYAYQDPNPVVAQNNTPALLRAAGMDVLHYPVPAIDDFYVSYAHWTRTRLPFVTVKMAQTLDGKIAGENSARVVLSNDFCSDFTQNQRLHTDVILTTATTINQDNPQFNARLSDRTVAKRVAVLDQHGKINPQAKIFETALQCIIYHQKGSPGFDDRASYYDLPTDALGFDLSALFRHLGQLGYHDVWVEAGARLFHALHGAGLVHRTYLYLVPRVLGPSALSLYADDVWLERVKEITWQPMGNNSIAILDH